MPTKYLLPLILSLLALPSCRAADLTFQLTSLAPLADGLKPSERLLTVFISGTAPPLTSSQIFVMAKPRAKDSTLIRLPVVQSPAQDPGTASISIDFFIDITPLAGADPDTFTYTVSIPSLPSAGQATLIPAKPASTHFASAPSKDKADLYFFGSVLAGASTKPLYVLDIKASPNLEVNHSGYFLGGSFTLAANQNATAPVDRSRVDPDSITGAFTAARRFDVGSGNHLALALQPLAGEFSRKFPASDLLTKGNLTFDYRPFTFFCSSSRCERLPTPSADPNVKLPREFNFLVYPGIGYEVGKNLNQPQTLFSQPVDLTRWSAIARLAPTAGLALYVFQRVPTADVPYRFTLNATYQPRIPFTLEPFVTTSGPAANLVKTTTLRKNTRHEVEATANYNVSSFVALTLNYRYGSLPPLFQFVDQQVTIGLTFKGAFKR